MSSLPIILSIDGNIGSGKSTLYKDLQEYYKNHPDICFVPEPVDDWTNIVDGENTPILTNLYKDTKRYAFRFQMMAYISRLHLLRQKVKENKYKIIISERSVQTDRNVFARMLYDDGMIEHDEYQIYNTWFDEFLDDMRLGGIIYVKADREICSGRVKIRGRAGETIAIEYLQKCHDYHETWLKDVTEKIVIEANTDTSNKENAYIRQEWVSSVDKWISSYLCDDNLEQPAGNNNNNNNSSGNDNTDGINTRRTMDESILIKSDNILPIIRFDGACRGNPSNVLGLGYIIKQTDNGDTKENTLYQGSYRYNTTNGTNNEAEYLSLIKGMELAIENKITKALVEGDSNLIINQMNGNYQVKAENLLPLYKQARELAAKFEFIHFVHIKREFNKEADKLANEALDCDDDCKSKSKSNCPGCEPRFQENQLAHIGPNGCLNEDHDNCYRNWYNV